MFEHATREPRRADLDAPRPGGNKIDYVAEKTSKYEIWQVLGWPFESSVAMARMVFSGMLERLPEPANHHAPLRRHGPVLRGPRRDLMGAAWRRRRPTTTADVLKRLKKPPWSISRCSTATRCWAARHRRCAAAWISSAPTKSCSRATAPSIPRAGQCSSAKVSARSRSSASRTATSTKSMERSPRSPGDGRPEGRER